MKQEQDSSLHNNTMNVMQNIDTEELNCEEQQYRAGAYSMLASLLRDIPTQEVVAHVKNLAAVEKQGDELSVSMSLLGLAASNVSLSSIETEYHDLFIGLGRGELVPFGSWYMTGFLMEKPLAALRDDLASLGFARSSTTHEPEDHVAALCEVMAMLIDEQAELQTQITFFNSHIAPWMGRFYEDLTSAKKATFYRSVGRFGSAFFNLESQYLAMKA